MGGFTIESLQNLRKTAMSTPHTTPQLTSKVRAKTPVPRKTAPVTAKRSRQLDPAIWDRLSSYKWNFEAMNER